jgi:hypothetical protein
MLALLNFQVKDNVYCNINFVLNGNTISVNQDRTAYLIKETLDMYDLSMRNDIFDKDDDIYGCIVFSPEGMDIHFEIHNPIDYDEYSYEFSDIVDIDYLLREIGTN